MPRKVRPPSPLWIEDGSRSWSLNAGKLEAYVEQAADDRWRWSVLAGAIPLRSPTTGSLSLVDSKLAAEDWLREIASAITRALG